MYWGVNYVHPSTPSLPHQYTTYLSIYLSLSRSLYYIYMKEDPSWEDPQGPELGMGKTWARVEFIYIYILFIYMNK